MLWRLAQKYGTTTNGAKCLKNAVLLLSERKRKQRSNKAFPHRVYFPLLSQSFPVVGGKKQIEILHGKRLEMGRLWSRHWDMLLDYWHLCFLFRLTSTSAAVLTYWQLVFRYRIESVHYEGLFFSTGTRSKSLLCSQSTRYLGDRLFI